MHIKGMEAKQFIAFPPVFQATAKHWYRRLCTVLTLSSFRKVRYFFFISFTFTLSLSFYLAIPEQKLVLNTLTVNIFIIMFSLCFYCDIYLNLVYFHVSWGEGWCSMWELWIIGFWAWCIVEQSWGLGVSDSERTSIYMLGAVLVVVLPPYDHMTETSTH